MDIMITYHGYNIGYENPMGNAHNCGYAYTQQNTVYFSLINILKVNIYWFQFLLKKSVICNALTILKVIGLFSPAVFKIFFLPFLTTDYPVSRYDFFIFILYEHVIFL